MTKGNGWSVFWRRRAGRKARPTLSYATANGWKQRPVPEEIVTEASAITWAKHWLAEQKISGHLDVGTMRGGKTIAA